VDRKEVLDYLRGRAEALRKMELLGPAGQSDERKSSKLEEVAGFCAIILRYVRSFPAQASCIRILECSCGKSYLGFALVLLLRELEGKSATLLGVDSNPVLIERCHTLAEALGLENAEFVCSRIAQLRTDRRFDLVVALHACDTATDEALAKGIELGAPLILAVPCCQNQIRGQIKSGHALTAMTDFGPVRYRLANLLTDALRAQFLRSAGYHVEMDEIGSPRLTPKNLCICARKVKRQGKTGRDREYRMLRDFFQVRPKIESYCPHVISGTQGDKTRGPGAVVD
jgi:hypothetical protein